MAEGSIAILEYTLVVLLALFGFAEMAYVVARRRLWQPTVRSRRVVGWALILTGVFALGFFVAAGVVAARWEAVLLFEALGYIGLGAGTFAGLPGWTAVDER